MPYYYLIYIFMTIHYYLFLAKIHKKSGNIAVLDLFIFYFQNILESCLLFSRNDYNLFYLERYARSKNWDRIAPKVLVWDPWGVYVSYVQIQILFYT